MLTKLAPNLLFKFDKGYANRPSINGQAVNQPVDFFQVEKRRYRLRHPVTALNQTVSPVVEGIHINPQRNFKWLPWILGKVSYVPLNNDIIITGEMSGCWLIIFTLNGQTCFGHIGTFQDSSHPRTIEAIQAWKIAKRSGKVTNVQGFNPVSVGPGTPFTFGAVTPNREFYTIGLDKVPGSQGMMPYKVIHVTRAFPAAMPY